MQAETPSIHELLQALLPPPPQVRRQNLLSEQHFPKGLWSSGLRQLFTGDFHQSSRQRRRTASRIPSAITLDGALSYRWDGYRQ